MRTKIGFAYILLIANSLFSMEMYYEDISTRVDSFAENDVQYICLNDDSFSEDEENFEEREKKLIINFENTFINFFSPKVKSAKGLAAVLIANYAVNHFAFSNAIRCDPRYYKPVERKGYPCKAVMLNRHYRRSAAENAMLTALYSEGWHKNNNAFIFDYARYKAYSAVKDLENDVRNELSTLPKQYQTMSDKEYFKMLSLHQLILQMKEKIFKYNENAFNAALEHLSKDDNFTSTKAEIIAIYGRHTWNDPSYKDNPYIESLKRIVECLARDIPDQEEVNSRRESGILESILEILSGILPCQLGS